MRQAGSTRRLHAAWALTLVLAGPPARAAEEPPSPHPPAAVVAIPMAGAVDPASYRLGPGDGLWLYIFGRISQTLPLPVGPDGRIFVPELGSIAVAGRTLADVQRDLEQRVASRFRDVRAQVRLERVRSFLVYLSGQVKAPGPIVAFGSSRPADVLVDSLLRSDASRRRIAILHRDGSSTEYDLLRFQRTGVAPPPGELADGDVIQVPALTQRVGVWGGVALPGRIELGSHDSLSTLLALAGGLLPAAKRDRALLVRFSEAGQESLEVSPADVEAGQFDLPLRDGDQLFVDQDPEYRVVHKVSVLGMVQREGSQPIVPGRTRVSDAIRAAGGFREGADLTAIRLSRVHPDPGPLPVEFERLSRLGRREMTDTEYETFRTQMASQHPDYRIAWARVASGSPELDPLLEDGDVIRVDRIQNSVRVDGQVLRPGVYPYERSRSWQSYVDLAGGFTNRSSRRKVLVTRSVNGQTVPARNVDTILPGDFVWVPERPDRTTWDQLKDVLAVGASIATVVIAFRR